MFDQPLSLVPAIILALACGLAVGFFTGILASRMLRLPLRARSILIDALLGALIFPLTFELVWLIPWRTTSTYRTGETVVTSISTHYSHPGRIAVGMAILLPLLHEVIRFRLAKKGQ